MNRSLIMLSVLVLPSGTGTSEGVYWSPVVYPAAGNIRAEAGTVEIWFRLDTNPLPGCYFSLVQLHYPADAATVLSFSYGDHMGNVVFRVAGAGRFFGMPVGSTYLTSALRGMTVKAPEPYPRHVSLAAKEWHYVALTWECPQPQTFRAYLDGKPIIPGGKVRGLVWHDLKQGRLQGPGGILTVDELRISSVCRPPEEIQRYYESVESRDTAPKLEVPEDEAGREEFISEVEGGPEPGLAQDEHTLLLDHFTRTDSDGQTARTVAAQVSGFSGERGGWLHPTAWKRVPGKFGYALQLWD